MYALDHRQQLSGRWGWMLVSGLIDIVLAGMIFAGLPGTAAWALGLLVGINMIFGGTALIAMGLHARSARGLAPVRGRSARAGLSGHALALDHLGQRRAR